MNTSRYSAQFRIVYNNIDDCDDVMQFSDKEEVGFIFKDEIHKLIDKCKNDGIRIDDFEIDTFDLQVDIYCPIDDPSDEKRIEHIANELKTKFDYIDTYIEVTAYTPKSGFGSYDPDDYYTEEDLIGNITFGPVDITIYVIDEDSDDDYIAEYELMDSDDTISKI